MVSVDSRNALYRAAVNLRLRKIATARRTKLLDDPVKFITETIGEVMWSKQREIAEAVRDYRHVAVHSAHDTGKTWLASRLTAWWLACHVPGDAFVVTTAPTFNQVRVILWREIGRVQKKIGLGYTNQTEWWLNDEIVAFGRKPSDYSPEAFQGIHAAAVLVVIDEASGVPENLYNAVETITTSEQSRVLAIGNPDTPQSHFGKICKPGSGWHVIHVDGFDWLEERDEYPILQPVLLSPLWVEERRQEWGEGTPLWQAKVRGVFPEDTSDGVIPLSWLRAAQEEREWTDDQRLPVELGLDVGAGGDLTVIFERTGAVAGRAWRANTPEPAEVCSLAVAAIKETGATAIKVDAIGIGWGIAGRLEELREEGVHGAKVIPVNVGQNSYNTEQFPKLRDQIWWELGRELTQSGGWDLSGIDDTTTAQLIAPKYKLDSSGRIKVEPKAETRKRLGRSPDDADALLLAYYVPPVQPTTGIVVYDDPVQISPY